MRRVLIGSESTPGTTVTVDTALRAVANLKVEAEKVMPDEDIGSLAPARNYVATYKGTGDLEMDGYYDGLPYVLSMALGSAASVSGGSPEYTWTFDIPEDAANDFETFTVEYTDGADHIVQGSDVFATSLEISGEAGEAVVFKAELETGKVAYPAALSATPSNPTNVNPVLMAHTSLYIDDAYGSIGGTQVNELISFNWKLDGLQHHKLYAGSYWPTGRGNDKWEITLELVLECEISKVQSEKDKLFTSALSAIRLRSYYNTQQNLIIDGMYVLTEVDTLDDRDGNNIIKLVYKGQKDTSNNTGTVVLESLVGAL